LIKKLFSNAAIYGFAAQIPKVASIIALPFVTPYLTPEDYGILGIIGSYTGAVIVLQNIGLSIILSNSFYHHRYHYKWIWKQIYGFLYLWYIPFNFILAGLLHLIIPPSAADYKIHIIVMTILPSLLFGPVVMLGTYHYQLRQVPLPIAIRSTLFSFLSVGLTIYFIMILNLGFMGWIYSGGIVGFLTALSYWYPVNITQNMKPILAIRWKYMLPRLKISLPLVPHYYSSYLLDSSDQLVMHRLGENESNIGLYNFPAKFGNYFSLIAGAFNQALSPMLMEAYKSGEEQKAKLLVFNFQLVLFFLTFSFALWAREIFGILVNNENLEDTYLLAIPIVMGYNYRAMYVGANARLFFYEKTKVLWKVTLTAGLFNVAFNFMLIPIYGVEIAAYTTFVALMYMGYRGFYLKAYKQLTSEKYYQLRWLLLTIFLLIIALFFVEKSLLLKLSVYLIFLLFIGGSFIYFLRKYERINN